MKTNFKFKRITARDSGTCINCDDTKTIFLLFSGLIVALCITTIILDRLNASL